MKIQKLAVSDISAALAQFVPTGKTALTDAEKQAKTRERRAYKTTWENKKNAKKREEKKQHIAILDMETDPFDNQSDDRIAPFLAVLYSDDFEPIVIWEEDNETFVNRLIIEIEKLPGAYTIYAHNGGKFDFMFLVHKLRGKVSFKGRGIMSAHIGAHELRDSFHIIPEKLASMQKQKFDYSNMKRKKRDKFRKEIIGYCISDCRNLLYYVKKFVNKFGFKISIGAAALAKLREEHEIERITEATDAKLRPFFFGGRVECIQGAGYFNHGQKLYDINSAYPNAMARQKHPVGSEYIFRGGAPNSFTAFVRLFCRNDGALMSRDEKGDVSTGKRRGEFFTTIHEYKMALQLGLISEVEIIECVDCVNWASFEKFVFPLYDARAAEKSRLATLPKGSEDWNECNSEQMLLKLALNNAYGKTAQNPRRFKEHWITSAGERPPRETVRPGEDGWETEFMDNDYWIWKRQSPRMRFLNVGTGASITGAVRAKLMLAIHHAINPVYCDTDSLICDELPNTELHPTDLGAWDLEKQITELVIAGKKLYAYRDITGETHVRSKGAAGLSFEDVVALFAGETKTFTNLGPTLTRRGDQKYISRQVRRTATLPERPAANVSCLIQSG